MLMRAWSAAPGAEVKGDRKGGEGEFHALPRTAGNSPPFCHLSPLFLERLRKTAMRVFLLHDHPEIPSDNFQTTQERR